MIKPKVLLLTGYRINCDDETRFAFEKAGADAETVHVNDLIDRKKKLSDYQVLAFCGGFSYGDDTGSGNAMAWRIKNDLWDEVLDFVSNDKKLTIGICNGFQILTNLGLVPAIRGRYGVSQVALVHNDSARYNCRWVDLQFTGNSPWTNGISTLSLPIAHGEGKFYANSEMMKTINEKNLVAARYIAGEMTAYQNLPYNPNGALEDIASITDESGRILGIMPHPERAISFTQLPNWHLLKEKYKREGREITLDSDGLKMFRNGVNYFR